MRLYLTMILAAALLLPTGVGKTAQPSTKRATRKHPTHDAISDLKRALREGNVTRAVKKFRKLIGMARTRGRKPLHPAHFLCWNIAAFDMTRFEWASGSTTLTYRYFWKNQLYLQGALGFSIGNRIMPEADSTDDTLLYYGPTAALFLGIPLGRTSGLGGATRFPFHYLGSEQTAYGRRRAYLGIRAREPYLNVWHLYVGADMMVTFWRKTATIATPDTAFRPVLHLGLRREYFRGIRFHQQVRKNAFRVKSGLRTKDFMRSWYWEVGVMVDPLYGFGIRGAFKYSVIHVQLGFMMVPSVVKGSGLTRSRFGPFLKLSLEWDLFQSGRPATGK